MPKERIVVVEDDADVLNLCQRILTLEGYQVTVASNGYEAIEAAKGEPFDLLLTDMMMPGLNGMETYQAIKEFDPDIIGVIITGYASFETAIEAVKLGFDGFVTKPFTPEELNAAVAKALERKRLERENARLRALIPLFEMSRVFMSTMDVDELLNQVVHTAKQEAQADRVSLMLLDEESGELTVEAAISLPEEATTTRQKVGEGIAGWVVRRGEPLLLNEGTPLDPRIRRAMRGEASSALCVPLKVKDRVIGVLNLSKLGGNPFAEGDLELASILCGQAAIAIENARLFEELRESFVGVIAALAAAIDAKDPYTHGHSERVARYAAEIARELGLETHEVETVHYAGLLHDIGKIGVSEQSLKKPDALDVKEWEVMKAHPAIGARILEPISLLKEIIPLVRHHHERCDGTGYPDGLAGEEIPLGARILAVADAFEVMTSPRPYSPAMSPAQAIALLQEGVGKQWDAEVMEALLRALEKERLLPLEEAVSLPRMP